MLFLSIYINAPVSRSCLCQPLKRLHWLLILYHITFKTAVLVHSKKNTGQHAYLRQPVDTLQSSSKNLINERTVYPVLAFRGFRHSVVSAETTYLTILVKLKLVTIEALTKNSSFWHLAAWMTAEPTNSVSPYGACLIFI